MKLKWDISGKGVEAWSGSEQSNYEGPVPPKGTYVAKIKRMTVSKIKGGKPENVGKPRISVLFEIVAGAPANDLDDPNFPYRGAPVWDGLNIIDAQRGKVQGFIHALTDGSEEAKRAVETAFWPPNGPDAKAEERKDGTKDLHIKKIGKYQINSPDGHHLIRIITKMGQDLQGLSRAEVTTYLPYIEPKPEAVAVTNGEVVAEEEDDDGLVDATEFLAGEDDEAVELDDVYAGADDDAPPF